VNKTRRHTNCRYENKNKLARISEIGRSSEEIERCGVVGVDALAGLVRSAERGERGRVVRVELERLAEERRRASRRALRVRSFFRRPRRDSEEALGGREGGVVHGVHLRVVTGLVRLDDDLGCPRRVGGGVALGCRCVLIRGRLAPRSRPIVVGSGEQPFLAQRPLRRAKSARDEAAHREGSRDHARQQHDDEHHRAKARAPAGRATPGTPHRASHRGSTSPKGMRISQGGVRRSLVNTCHF
jgi:hypothetical protein